MEMKIIMMACNNCESNFYVDESEDPILCAFCGNDDIYSTYSFFAEPTLEEM